MSGTKKVFESDLHLYQNKLNYQVVGLGAAFELLHFYKSCKFVIADIQQHYVVINCSWPCPTISDTCILTKDGAQCQPKGINEWDLIAPSRAPVYTGAYSSVENHTCIPAPIPSLPVYQNATVLSKGQTVIQWPIMATFKSLDNYLGNCNHGMFCSSTGDDEDKPICRKDYPPGSKCVSSNQCRRSHCSSGICHQSSEYSETGQSQELKDTEKHRQTKKTIIIVASIVSILGVIAIIVLVFAVIRYRRRRVKHHLDTSNKNKDFNLFNEASDFDSPPDTLKAQIRQVSVDATQEDITPSMQQNALQKELLKSHHKHSAKPPSFQI